MRATLEVFIAAAFVCILGVALYGCDLALTGTGPDGGLRATVDIVVRDGQASGAGGAVPEPGEDAGIDDGPDGPMAAPGPQLQPIRAYSLGNSLTVDAQPWMAPATAALAGASLDIGWYITCGQTLPYLVDTPPRDTHPRCVPEVPHLPDWQSAFGLHARVRPLDYVIIQPAGPSISEEIRAVGQMVRYLGPAAEHVTFVVWATWGPRDEPDRWDTVSTEPNPTNSFSADYARHLVTAIQDTYGRPARAIYAGEVFKRLRAAWGTDAAYRDAIHANVRVGRYAAHAAYVQGLTGVDLHGLRPWGDTLTDAEYEVIHDLVQEAQEDMELY